jgi:GT2 family glycosyltransferase
MLAVTIVTFNSAKYIQRCLKYVLEQDLRPHEIVVIDNASVDETPSILRNFEDRLQIVYNRSNTGFAAAQNQAIALTRSPWVLTLNPDIRLTPRFTTNLLEAASQAEVAVGSICGKLLTMGPDFEIPLQSVIDSTGIYMTPNLRHFDRGSRILDKGQYERAEYVFGGTGAACLYRRRMIDDISVDGEFFDTDFFAYREDADVAWRAQLLGWKCLYTPVAVAYHVRSVLPSNRSSVPAVLNMHSVKNRFLLRIKNATSGVYKRFWLAMSIRDVAVIGGCILHEWSSLPAFVFVVRRLPATLQKRRAIMQRRRTSDGYLTQWFAWRPFSTRAALEPFKEPHAV